MLLSSSSSPSVSWTKPFSLHLDIWNVGHVVFKVAQAFDKGVLTVKFTSNLSDAILGRVRISEHVLAELKGKGPGNSMANFFVSSIRCNEQSQSVLSCCISQRVWRGYWYELCTRRNILFALRTSAAIATLDPAFKEQERKKLEEAHAQYVLSFTHIFHVIKSIRDSSSSSSAQDDDQSHS